MDESNGTTCGLHHFVITMGMHLRNKKEFTFSLMSPFGVACDEKINDLNKYLLLVRRLAQVIEGAASSLYQLHQTCLDMKPFVS